MNFVEDNSGDIAQTKWHLSLVPYECNLQLYGSHKPDQQLVDHSRCMYISISSQCNYLWFMTKSFWNSLIEQSFSFLYWKVGNVLKDCTANLTKHAKLLCSFQITLASQLMWKIDGYNSMYFRLVPCTLLWTTDLWWTFNTRMIFRHTKYIPYRDCLGFSKGFLQTQNTVV